MSFYPKSENMKHELSEYLKDIQSEDLLDELKKRGLFVDVWDKHDVNTVENMYKDDHGIEDDILIKKEDAIEILRIAQEHLDNNVGMNWSILQAHFIDYINTNNLI